MTSLLDSPEPAGSTLYSPQAVGSPESVAEDFYVRGPERDIDRRVEIQLVGAEATPRGVWLAKQIESRLNVLLRLRASWDGYRGQPLTETSVHVAVDLFFAMADEMSFPPQIFPLVDGGIQLEWHAGGEDIEMEVDRDGHAHVLGTDQRGEVVLDTLLSLADGHAIAKARVALRQLSERITAGLSARE